MPDEQTATVAELLAAAQERIKELEFEVFFLERREVQLEEYIHDRGLPVPNVPPFD